MPETPTPAVVETTSDSFEHDVILRSRDLPVVVDFWAPWCQPCRMLGPLLERLHAEYEGRFALVKADIDQMPELAGAFGVSSIPAVFALKDGQVVDYFVGVLSEREIRAFLDRLMPTPAEVEYHRGRTLEATDPAGAEAAYRASMALAPDYSLAAIGLARVLLATDRLDEAREQITTLERRGYLEPEAETVKAELTLRSGAAESGTVEAARAEATADPADFTKQLHLAEALAAAGQHAEALERALDLVERDRRGTGEEARKLMLAVFQLLPPDSDLANDFRRRLSVAL